MLPSEQEPLRSGSQSSFSCLPWVWAGHYSVIDSESHWATPDPSELLTPDRESQSSTSLVYSG